jgi:signal transduction histidine kinase/ActR/RegA family two-component response regulator
MKLARTRWRDWSLAKKGAAVVALPLALLLAALYSNYTLQRDVSRADEDVQRTLTVRADIHALHTLIAEAASGVRGYLLTGREEFLSPYWMAQQRIPQTLTKLRETIRDPAQAERLERASVLVATKLASLEQLRLEGAQLEPEALQSHLRANKRVLDVLRKEIIELGEGEAQLITERIAAAAEARRRESIANVAMAVIGLAGAAVALWLLTSGIIRRVQTAATNAERLASGLPLMPPPVARDEVGLLAERLHRASLLLAERAEQARAANLAKTEFLSRTSHELRTPLNVILGFAQLLEADLRDTPSAGNVVHVLGAGRHLLSLIDEMLDISSIESGAMKLQPEAVALDPLLREAVALVEPLALRSDVRLDLGDFSGLAVHADRQRLRQVVLNLLSNAVKFNKPGGTVTLAAARVLDEVRIAVTDTGIGIRPEDLARLFSPFERLDAERRGIEGTGLGLAISQQLVKRMAGSIDVSSEPGRGSVFTVTLAAADPQALPPAAPQTATIERGRVESQAPLNVLYIEDNGPNIALIQALMVRRPRWQLHVARTAQEGLQRARELRPQLVLIDLHLPDQSGEAVLQALRSDEQARDAVFAILSADALPATMERLRASGAAEYLTKPIDVSRLFALLDRVAA